MKKLVMILVFAFLALIALAGFGSAYNYGGYYDPYYGQGRYDAHYTYNVRTSGGYYGPQTTTATTYNRVTEKYWNGRQWIDRTTYVKEKVETPHYYAPTYAPSYYDGYRTFYPSYSYRAYGYNYPRTSYW